MRISQPLRILLVEDSDLDLELTAATLADGGVAHEFVRAQTEDEFRRALGDSRLDLVLSDYILPAFSGLSALEIASQLRPDLPFIFLSGALGEELAIESLKGGATDYVLKQRMERLVPAVRRAVAEADERRRRKLVEERFRRLVEEVRDYAIIFLDAEGRVTEWNVGATRILGWSEVEMLGRTMHRIFTPDDRAAAAPEQEIATAARDGRSGDDRWQLRKDGTRFFASGIVTALRGPRDALVGFVKILRDVSDRQRAEEERTRLLAAEREARQEAEVASRAKDEFIATLSHELRTPLNAILGWANLLRSGRMDPAAAEHGLEVIERNAKVQGQLIGDILDMSRIISGKMHLEAHLVDLSKVVEAAIDAVRLAADAKHIAIEFSWDVGAAAPPRPAVVRGDRNRLQQVFWNLLANAVKFTPRGGRVDVRASRIGSNVRVAVTDNGAGIDADFLPHVFERFRQADGSIRRAHGGLGLGLAIVRHLLELHGGAVHAHSEGEGKGATFTVSLPLIPLDVLEAARTPVGVPRATGGNGNGNGGGGNGGGGAADEALDDGVGPAGFDCPPRLDGTRVLLVDDEPDALALLGTVLRECGAKITSCSSAAEAIDALRAARFDVDVIVSDIGMPVEDGYSFIRRVRAEQQAQDGEAGPARRSRGGRIPAVALTAYASARDGEQALAAGFDRHAIKPITPHELATVVSEVLQEQGPAQHA